ncbi:calmodulin-binding transcription activator 1 isoform X22 [Hylobates moloch]|uniref:calmodulin-binding transcription activator 1 isoform X22 n=1 Tax=Hylobates moloch TaxID=81572 RepID=UPI0013F26D71|nr:calmodulin-binding transcription activator 1 isoform X22 [Hylobates moloch]XP_055117944.1 calmodulin-binding transcription activator 1 isoform X13 [Symphalangus syndactylus]
MWRAEGKWLPKTSRKSVSQSVFCGTSTYCVLNTVPPIEDDHGNSNSSHVKIFLPKKLLECLPKCSSLPKERHRWNTNEKGWNRGGDGACWQERERKEGQHRAGHLRRS